MAFWQTSLIFLAGYALAAPSAKKAVLSNTDFSIQISVRDFENSELEAYLDWDLTSVFDDSLCAEMPSMTLYRWDDPSSATASFSEADCLTKTPESSLYTPDAGCRGSLELEIETSVCVLGPLNAEEGEVRVGNFSRTLPGLYESNFGPLGIKVQCGNQEGLTTVLGCAKFEDDTAIDTFVPAEFPVRTGLFGQFSDTDSSTFGRISIINESFIIAIDANRIGNFPNQDRLDACFVSGIRADIHLAFNANDSQTSLLGDACSTEVVGARWDEYYACSAISGRVPEETNNRCECDSGDLATRYALRCTDAESVAADGQYKCDSGDISGEGTWTLPVDGDNQFLNITFRIPMNPPPSNGLSVKFSCGNGDPLFCASLTSCTTVRDSTGKSQCDGDFEVAVIDPEPELPSPTPSPSSDSGSGSDSDSDGSDDNNVPAPTPTVATCDDVFPLNASDFGSFKFNGDGCRMEYWASSSCSGDTMCHDLQPTTCLELFDSPFTCNSLQITTYFPGENGVVNPCTVDQRNSQNPVNLADNVDFTNNTCYRADGTVVLGTSSAPTATIGALLALLYLFN